MKKDGLQGEEWTMSDKQAIVRKDNTNHAVVYYVAGGLRSKVTPNEFKTYCSDGEHFYSLMDIKLSTLKIWIPNKTVDFERATCNCPTFF